MWRRQAQAHHEEAVEYARRDESATGLPPLNDRESNLSLVSDHPQAVVLEVSTPRTGERNDVHGAGGRCVVPGGVHGLCMFKVPSAKKHCVVFTGVVREGGVPRVGEHDNVQDAEGRRVVLGGVHHGQRVLELYLLSLKVFVLASYFAVLYVANSGLPPLNQGFVSDNAPGPSSKRILLNGDGKSCLDGTFGNLLREFRLDDGEWLRLPRTINAK